MLPRRSRTYHPDRAPTHSNADQAFITLRKAYETLSNPVHRYAYDRFGPDITDWFPGDIRKKEEGEMDVREYMRVGLMRSGGFYLVSGGIMVLLAGTLFAP